MNCLRCNTSNEEEAKFCKNCGMDMAYTPSHESTNSKSSDTFLIIFVIIAFIGLIVQYTIENLVENWYEKPTKYFQGAFWILQNLSFLLIPLAIRNKVMKIVGFIMITIIVIYWIYSNVKFITG